MESERFSLIDSLNLEWLKLPLAVMQDVGPAAQTLGGLLKVTTKETFCSVAVIARHARVPIATCRRHLAVLDDHGWIKADGRQRTRRGHLRRTATVRITAKTKAAIEPYGVLPWWACCSVRRVGRMPWSARAVLSVVLARLMGLKSAIEQNNGNIADPDDVLDFLVNLEEDRFEFSLSSLIDQTGLARNSIVTAKRHLHGMEIFFWEGGERDDGGFNTDRLSPNWDFRVIETPAGPGRCYLNFRGKS